MSDPWFTQYVNGFLRQQGQNNAARFGVTIERTPNATYRAIGTHHMTPAENKGNHHAYIIILDARGKRIKGIPVGYTWVGRQDYQNAPPVTDDKPDNEPGANIPMGMYQTISLWVEGIGPSDVVSGITPAHPDEAPGAAPGSVGGNTLGHHSFLIVFQEGERPPATGIPPKEETVVPSEEGTHPPATEFPDLPAITPITAAIQYELTNATNALANAQAILNAVKGVTP